ncbi:MAG: hypothetical protein Q8932_03200, partial [Bacteroidota bacterium]|nr:hypothetical protein [Bacteroidota bacterium]
MRFMDRDQQRVFRLAGTVQHYAWGGRQFLPGLLERPNPDARPFAEYWMGAHENASSELLLPGTEQSPCPQGFAVNPQAVDFGTRGTIGACTEALNTMILSGPEDLLGAYTAARFGRLPYLLKILDVKDMLSIQVHPSKKVAEQAFLDENRKGIPLTAPDRNYKDDNHKPELMVALSEFWLLHGFKPAEQLRRILQQTPELRELETIFGEGSYLDLYTAVMHMEPLKVNRMLQPLLDRIIPLYKEDRLSRDSEDFWAA